MSQIYNFRSNGPKIEFRRSLIDLKQTFKCNESVVEKALPHEVRLNSDIVDRDRERLYFKRSNFFRFLNKPNNDDTLKNFSIEPPFLFYMKTRHGSATLIHLFGRLLGHHDDP